MYDTPDFDKQMNMTPGEKAIERLRNRASFMAEDYHQDLDIVEKELKERKNLATMCDELAEIVGLKDKDYLELKEIIKKALEKGKEDEKMVGIFKNALTIEHHDLPMLEPHDDSEDFVTYASKTLTTIRQNELDKSLRQALREWVLKNAFPKEKKVLDIITTKGVNVGNFKAMLEDWKDLTFENYISYRIENSYELQSDYDFETKPLNEQEFNLVKESILCHW